MGIVDSILKMLGMGPAQKSPGTVPPASGAPARSAAGEAAAVAVKKAEETLATVERKAAEAGGVAANMAAHAAGAARTAIHEAGEKIEALAEAAEDRMEAAAEALEDRFEAAKDAVGRKVEEFAGAAASAAGGFSAKGNGDAQAAAAEMRSDGAIKDHPEGRNCMSKVTMTVNGRKVEREVEDRTLLVQFLREDLNLTGTHVGCDTSQCGACVVHVDGVAVKSCTMLAAQASGSSVTTVEGLAKDGQLHPVQEAFREHHGLQCGFCTPGMIMTAVDMIERAKKDGVKLDEHSIRHQLEGNICRCTGYHNIVRAIETAAAASA